MVGGTAQYGASSAAATVQDAAHTVTIQASTVTRVVANRVQDVADSIRQSGSSPDASDVQRQAAHTTAGVLDKTAQYLGPGGLHTLVGDVRSSIQRQPLRSLVIGVGVGYLLRARSFPAQATPTPSTPPAQPSTPPLPPTPPAPSSPAASTQPDVDVSVSTSSDMASAPLLETRTIDTSLATGNLGTPRTLTGDDVLDTDMGLGMTGATDVADTGLDRSIGTGDLYTDAIDSDLSVGRADTDLRSDMADAAALGDDSVDVDMLGSDTLMDDSVSGDMLDTRSASATSIDATLSSMDTLDTSGMSSMGTPTDSTFRSSSSTTPLSTDNLSTGTSLTDDASNAGTTDLGDVLSHWDERTRGEGSPS